MRSNNNKNSKRGGGGDAEVEELLKAAEDEMLLNLKINSHTTATNLELDSDLLRRFDALKSPSVFLPSSGTTTTRVSLPTPSPLKQQQRRAEEKFKGQNQYDYDGDELERILLGADLSSRFAALKNKPSSSTTTSSSTEIQALPNRSDGSSMDGDEDDEVTKLIKWAIDAARLDPSPPTDDDNDNDDDDDQDEDEEDDDSDDDDPPKKKASVVRIKRKR